MSEVEKNHVYVVTVIEPHGEPRTETLVFDNEDEAKKAWRYYVDISYNVLTNYCPIYKKFEAEHE